MSLLDKASLIQIPSGYKNGKLYSVKPTPTFGSELVTNGDFATDSDWTLGSNTSISNGALNFSSATSNTDQSLTTTNTKIYKVVFTISDYVSGSVRFRFTGTANVNGISRSTNGTFTEYITATANNSIFRFAASAFSGSIDNVSVKEVLKDGDFDFSRSSSATRVNSEGLIETASVLGSELVTNGDFSDGLNNWSVVGGTFASVSNGVLNSNNTSSGSWHSQYIGQELSFINGKTYRIKFKARNVSGNLNLRLTQQAFIIFTQNITSEFVDYTVYYTAQHDGYQLRFFCNDNVGQFEIDNISVKEVIENDVPRLDYSGGASCASLLLEPQTQNLVTYSEDFSQWNALTPGDITYVSDLVNPDGSVGGYKISGDGMYKALSLLTTTQRSIYARSVSGSGDVQLFTHYSNTNNVFTLTEEWQRFDVNSITSASAVGNYYIDLRGASSTLSELYVWGAQATNDQSYVTSYIPTSGSTVTRTADVCNNAGTSATFNSTEGVLFAEIAALANDGTYRMISLSDGTATNRISFFYQNTPSNRIAVESAGSGTNLGIYNQSLTITNSNKIAVKYKANDCALWVNGVEIATDTSFAAFSSGTFTKLSFDRGDGVNDFYGKCKQLMVFDEALSDEELSDLTGQVNLSFNNLATFYNYTIL